jgi:hypothetical protein
LFPYGCGGPDERRKTQLSLESYMTNALQLSSRHFAQHHSFPLAIFDVLVQNYAATSNFVHCKIRPIDAAQVVVVTEENLRIQLDYQDRRQKNLFQGLPLPLEPPTTNGPIFALQDGIRVGLAKY